MSAKQLSLGVCLSALVHALAGSASAQTTWYVDVNAVPPGSGTQASPYASIQYAIDRPTTIAGDTVLVAPGTYVELVGVGKAITVRSSAGPMQTIVQVNSGDDGVVISATASVFEGFTVLANTGWSGIFLMDGTVRRCIVRDCTAISGIEVLFGTIESSTIVGCARHGVAASHFGSIRIHNSIAWGNLEDNLSATPSSASYNAGFSAPGVGNLAGDPGLWNLAERDLHLRPGSPCIDAGDPVGPLDPDGSRMDIGALTYDPTYAPAPAAYCAGKLNSQGCTPAIGALGSASASSAGPFSITAANEVDNKPGLLLLAFGKSAQPFQGATLCVQSPIKRLGPQNSGGAGACTGTYAFDMQAYVQSGAHPSLVPGAIGCVQWWSRDPLDPAGFGSGLSDALSFGVAP